MPTKLHPNGVLKAKL